MIHWNKTLACLALSSVLLIAGQRTAHAQGYQDPSDSVPPSLPVPQSAAPSTTPWPTASGASPSATAPGGPLVPPTTAPAPAVTPAPYIPAAPVRPLTYQEPIGPAYATAPPAAEVTVAPTTFAPYVESSWYVRADYFHWNERLDGFDLVNEDGELTTIGYERRIGRERFRAELFGGSVHYDGYAQFDDGSIEPLTSHTNYLGIRAEYEAIFEPEWLYRSDFLLGLGTRFWIRDLPDGMTQEGDPVAGYEETWWTIYPYIGLEKKRLVRDGVEFYWSDRIGLTAVTYQHASIGDQPLWPKPGITTRAEFGFRGPHWFVAAELETMAWGQSSVVDGWLQPASTLFTAGLQTGFTF